MIGLFLTDPMVPTSDGQAPTPIATFDHWEDLGGGVNYAAATGDGHFLGQQDQRGDFHADAPRVGPWETMARSGQGVQTQHNEKRFTYYWMNVLS